MRKGIDMFQMEVLDHVALYVRDLQQSIDWYKVTALLNRGLFRAAKLAYPRQVQRRCHQL